MSGYEWTDWQATTATQGGSLDPYDVWNETIKGATPEARARFIDQESGRGGGFTNFEFSIADNVQALSRAPRDTLGNKSVGGSGAVAGRLNPNLGRVSVAVPDFAENRSVIDNLVENPSIDWYPDVPATGRGDDVALSVPPEDAVIVGVIDRGIALGHRSQQLPNGNTRIAAAWQQIVDRGKVGNAVSNKLPFGAGFLARDLDTLLTGARTGPANPNSPNSPNSVDQEAFNRSVGSENYTRKEGHRELGGAVAHGCHVLDAATGSWLSDASEEEFRRRVRPMVVNLPDRSIIGLDSRYLTSFVILGIAWMVETADRLWDAAYKKPDGPKENLGYPIVINLSFAKLAGAKDGMDEISGFIELINEERKGYRPIHLVVPAGNDNQSRGYAEFHLKGTKTEEEKDASKSSTGTLRLRVSPSDQSANYVEVWSEASNGTPQILVTVDPPGGLLAGPTKAPGAGQVSFMLKGKRPLAAIYTDHAPTPPGTARHLFRHLICISPTENHEGASPEAPAGVWTIGLTNLADEEVYVSLGVQTDQSPQPASARAHPAYFDDAGYQRFDPAKGSRLDSDDVRTTRLGSPVQRHGTLNALGGISGSAGDDLAAADPVTIVGGFRPSDGKPADYSSTGWLTSNHSGSPTPVTPHCALPTDDGAAHLGRLGAGAGDGSVRSMQGTSFACAQMTRLIALRLMGGGFLTGAAAAVNILNTSVVPAEGKWGKTSPSHPAKVGKGRFTDDSTVRSRVTRVSV